MNSVNCISVGPLITESLAGSAEAYDDSLFRVCSGHMAEVSEVCSLL